MDTHSHIEFLTLRTANFHLVSCIVVHTLYYMYNPFIDTDVSQSPPQNLSRYPIECTLQVHKGELQSFTIKVLHRQELLLEMMDDEDGISSTSSWDEGKLHFVHVDHLPNALVHYSLHDSHGYI